MSDILVVWKANKAFSKAYDRQALRRRHADALQTVSAQRQKHTAAVCMHMFPCLGGAETGPTPKPMTHSHGSQTEAQ